MNITVEVDTENNVMTQYRTYDWEEGVSFEEADVAAPFVLEAGDAEIDVIRESDLELAPEEDFVVITKEEIQAITREWGLP